MNKRVQVCTFLYSGLTLNQYGKARQRRTGLKLIHYIDFRRPFAIGTYNSRKPNFWKG